MPNIPAVVEHAEVSPLALPGVHFGATGITLPDNLPIEQAGRIFTTLTDLGDASRWAIGDLINFAEHQYGEKYSQFLDSERSDYQRLADYAWVSKSIHFSLRNENLSWSHHREVAKLPPEQQRECLRIAEQEGLTVRALRERITGKAQKPLKFQDAPQAAALPEPKTIFIEPTYTSPPAEARYFPGDTVQDHDGKWGEVLPSPNGDTDGDKPWVQTADGEGSYCYASTLIPAPPLASEPVYAVGDRVTLKRTGKPHRVIRARATNGEIGAYYMICAEGGLPQCVEPYEIIPTLTPLVTSTGVPLSLVWHFCQISHTGEGAELRIEEGAEGAENFTLFRDGLRQGGYATVGAAKADAEKGMVAA